MIGLKPRGVCACCGKDIFKEGALGVSFDGITICEDCITSAAHLLDPYPDD